MTHLPLPESLLTVRSLGRYLEDLTMHSMRQGGPRGGYKFTRSDQSLYRIATIYQQLTGATFGKAPGKTNSMLVFTPEQFTLLATVVVRSTMDGSSYEYNLRRELDLPATGWGFGVTPPAPEPGHGSPESEPESAGSGGASGELQAQLEALRREVAELKRKPSGDVSVDGSASQVGELTRQLSEVRALVTRQAEMLQEQRQVIEGLRSAQVQQAQAQQGQGAATSAGEGEVTAAALAELRADFKKDHATLEQLTELLDLNDEDPKNVRLETLAIFAEGLAQYEQLFEALCWRLGATRQQLEEAYQIHKQQVEG